MPRRRSSRVDQTCDALTHIVRRLPAKADGWLPPTAELAETLAVSRTVMREAVSRLASQGLIEVRHGIGLRAVSRLDRPVTTSVEMLVPDHGERLRQSLEARALLEVELARRAASRITPAQIAELQRLQQALGAAADLTEQVDLDLAFHRQIAAAAGNDVLALLLESLATLGRESRRVTIGQAGVARAIATHAPIIEALAAGDATAAAAAMAAHLSYAVDDLRPTPTRSLSPSAAAY